MVSRLLLFCFPPLRTRAATSSYSWIAPAAQHQQVQTRIGFVVADMEEVVLVKLRSQVRTSIRLVVADVEEVCTYKVEITEFGHTNTDSTKAAVYSFRILVLEFLTSRRPIETIVVDEFPNPVTPRGFVDSVIMNGDIRRVLQLVDPDFASSLLIQEEEDRLMDLLKLALSCTHPVPDNRPKMTEALSLLVKLKII